MKSKAILMTLAMMSAALAGCTGSDGVTDMDDEALQQLFDDNIQDFMNNTTVEVHNNYYQNSTTINHNNGSVVGTEVYHAMFGAKTGDSGFEIGNLSEFGPDIALAVRGDTYPQDDMSNSALNLASAKVCLGTGSFVEGVLGGWNTDNGVGVDIVPVADAAEATAELVSGSCDAMAGSRLFVEEKVQELESAGDCSDCDMWITTDFIGYASPNSAGQDFSSRAWSWMEITIEQEIGSVAVLSAAHASVRLNIDCISNCSTNSSFSEIFEFELPVDTSNPFPPGFFGTNVTPEPGISTDCDSEYQEWSSHPLNGYYLAPPGMDCSISFVFLADYQITSLFYPLNLGNIDDYDFEWGDWSYHLFWVEAPVTTH